MSVLIFITYFSCRRSEFLFYQSRKGLSPRDAYRLGYGRDRQSGVAYQRESLFKSEIGEILVEGRVCHRLEELTEVGLFVSRHLRDAIKGQGLIIMALQIENDRLHHLRGVLLWVATLRLKTSYPYYSTIVPF